MRRFLINSFLFLIPVVILLVSLNYYVDISNSFNTDYSKKIAKILCRGDHVTNLTNYNDRICQKEVISCLQNVPETIVLGSSRGMLIRGEYYNSNSFFNHCVTSASVEDLIAIYQMYAVVGNLPKEIIVCIDPWYFEENTSTKWQAIADYYFDFKNTPNTLNHNANTYKLLFSIANFQSNIKGLFSERKMIVPEKAIQKFNDLNTLLNDGSLTYGSLYRNMTKRDRKILIQDYIDAKLKNKSKMREINDNKWEDFIQLINTLKKRGQDLSFILPPLHPLTYEKLGSSLPIIDLTENKIEGLAKELNLPITGSFDPQNVGLDEHHFYDAIHCNELGIIKLMHYSTNNKV